MKPQTNNYLYKVKNRNARTRCKRQSKLTIKTPERPTTSFWYLYCQPRTSYLTLP